MKTLFLFTFTALVLVSIYSCECYNTCSKQNYISEFVSIGFSDTELTPVLLKRYTAGSNFTTLVDSYTISSFQDAGWSGDGIDENRIFADNLGEYDYTINLPTAGRNFEVTNLNWQTEVCKKCGQRTIINTLRGYTINGEVKSTLGRVEIQE